MQVYRSGIITGLLVGIGLLSLAACGRGAAPDAVTSTTYATLPARCVVVLNGGAYSVKNGEYEFVFCANPENGQSRFERKVGENGWEETVFRR